MNTRILTLGWTVVKHVDIRELKRWVQENLRPESKLREVIQLEPDYLLPQEYLAKMNTWLKLYDIEKKHEIIQTFCL